MTNRGALMSAEGPALVLPSLTMLQMRDRVEAVLARRYVVRDGLLIERAIRLDDADEAGLLKTMLFLESAAPHAKPIADLIAGRRSRW